MTASSLTPISLALYDADFGAFSNALTESFQRHGFAVVADHGLDPTMIDDADADAKAFFALPDDVKRGYLIPGLAGQRGYTAFGIETAKGAEHHDLKEFWHVGRELQPGDPDGVAMPPNIWPREIAGFRQHTLALFAALEGLGGRILRAIAPRLGVGAGYFDAATRNGNSILRLLHYPPAPFDGPHIRAGAHEDINAITLLLGAEEAGLQILDRSGDWLPIQPPQGAVVVNIGDMLARLTNDILPSTTHRVVNPAPERRGLARYSMPFFLHFRSDFLIDSLPAGLSDGRPARYPGPITAGDFLAERLREIRLS